MRRPRKIFAMVCSLYLSGCSGFVGLPVQTFNAPAYRRIVTQYLTPEGLQTLAKYESSGNPLAQNPKSTASGLYGFLTSTWQTFAPQAGVDLSIYPTAKSAPADIQTQVALITPVSNWTCPRCDPGFTNQLASNPQWLSNTPVTDATSSGNGFTSTLTMPDPTISNNPGSTYTPAYDPNNPQTWSWYGLPNPYGNTTDLGAGTGNQPSVGQTLGGLSGSLGGIGTAISGITSTLSNPSFWQRVAIVIVGLIVLVGALILLGARSYEHSGAPVIVPA